MSNTQYLTIDDWRTFIERFPDADVFLRERCLYREREMLRHLFEPSEWEKTRLGELEYLDLQLR